MYYYWLIPDEPHKSRLANQIEDFSKIYKGPIFDPHLTLGTSNVLLSPIDGVARFHLTCTHVAT